MNLRERIRDRALTWSALGNLNNADDASLAVAVANLTPEEIAAVNAGRFKEEAAAAPGGGLAALLALLGQLFQNPQILSAVIGMISMVIQLFNPPAPTPTPPTPAKL